MPNYDFEDKPLEKTAERMFHQRACFIFMGLLSYIGPIVLITAANGDKKWAEVSTWMSLNYDQKGDVKALKNPFVCSAPRNPISGICFAPSVESFDKTRCIWYEETHLTYEDAVKKCQEKYGTLAGIADAGDNNIVNTLCRADAPCWIGLVRAKGLGNWQWLDGSAYNFAHWAADHPLASPKDDKGAVVVLGYKRWAGKLMAVTGLISIIMISAYMFFILCVCVVMHKSLSAKWPGCLLCTSCCDCIHLIFLLTNFVVMCVSLQEAKSRGFVGSVITLMVLMFQLLLLLALIHSACRLRRAMVTAEGKEAE